MNASKFIIFMLGVLISAQTSLSDIVVSQRASKICQLIGDWDKQRNMPTMNLTGIRYNLPKTDLGVPFTHNGRTFILFGDTWTFPVEDDPIAFSDDKNLEDGLSMTFLANSNGNYRPVQIPGVSLSAFEVPMEGVSVNGKMYIYATTGHSSTVVIGRSVLAVSNDNGYNFSYLYDFSSLHFMSLSIVKVQSPEWKGLPEFTGEGLIIFGSGQYRASNVRLAFQPADQIETPSSRLYFSGLAQSGQPIWSNIESDAIALFDQPYVGELSVSYNKFIHKWIMLYNAPQPRGINMRTADKPWGAWSEPQVIFDPVTDQGYCYFMHASWLYAICDNVSDPGRENEWGGEYGPYQFEDFATGNPWATTIYFTMSTWNPYTVVLMKAVLGRTGSNGCEVPDYDYTRFADFTELARFARYWLMDGLWAD
jgi:hypothetical protein